MARQLNNLFALIMITIIMANIIHNPATFFSMGTIRLEIMFAINLLNIALLNAGKERLFNILLTFTPPLVLFYMPSVFGFTENESYFYYPICIIAISLIPALILKHHKDFTLLVISWVYFALIIFFSDNIITHFSESELIAKEYIDDFYVRYKIVPLAEFFVFQLLIFSIRRMNYKDQNELVEHFQKIENQNKALGEQNDVVKIQKENLLKQKEIIKRQKKDLTDSINYAKFIQSSILPEDAIMKYLFPKHFILNKPKDIVSGDFYWVGKQGDNIYLALSDCTGHGVPGAFLSILSSSLLNEVFNTLVSPSSEKFIQSFRKYLLTTLQNNKKEFDSNIGLDLGLINLNKKTGELQFSGAGQNLYLIRNKEVIELMGNKYAMSINDTDQHEYLTERIILKEGDTIYMLSDGYPDQFGEEESERFGKTRLMELLLEIHDLPLYKQFIYMDEKIEKWKGNYKQLDDILVIGIQI